MDALPLLSDFQDTTVVLTADHGDCWGEDGLWEQVFPSPHPGGATLDAGQGLSAGLRAWGFTLSDGYQSGAWGSSGTGRQRQSGGSLSISVVGRSLPAARCATAVSTLITARQLAIRL